MHELEQKPSEGADGSLKNIIINKIKAIYEACTKKLSDLMKKCSWKKQEPELNEKDKQRVIKNLLLMGTLAKPGKLKS